MRNRDSRGGKIIRTQDEKKLNGKAMWLPCDEFQGNNEFDLLTQKARLPGLARVSFGKPSITVNDKLGLKTIYQCGLLRKSFSFPVLSTGSWQVSLTHGITNPLSGSPYVMHE